MSKQEIHLKNSISQLCFHVQVDYDQKGIQSVSLQPSSNKGLQWSFSTAKQDPEIEKQVNQWFQDYSEKKVSCIQLPFDWTSVPTFTQEVLRIVEQIPFGSFSTYGRVAQELGRKQAARAVGRACGRNPFVLFIPCHRVLDANLELRGYSAGGISVKQNLLTFEESKI